MKVKSMLLGLVLATSAHATDLLLTWASNAPSASGVVIERSMDNITITTVGRLSGPASAFTDYTVPYPVALYYRVKNVGDGVNWSDSPYSEVAVYLPPTPTPSMPATLSPLPRPGVITITVK